MSTVILTIKRNGNCQQVELAPKGTIIGRDPECNIVLDSNDVSRKHARIFQDPFDRWIIEDLSSHNGIFVNNKRIQAYAILPGESISIGSFLLSIEPSLSQQIKQDNSIHMTSNILEDEFEAEIISVRAKTDQILSSPYLKQLNEMNERLSELTDPSELYPEVCKCLAQTPKTVAAVLRLPESKKPLPESPNIVTCYFRDNTEEATDQEMSNLYLSRRVLEAVRSTGNVVMAKSISSSDTDMVLTISDEHSPRVVICAPLSAATEVIDLLYLDTPIEHTTSDTFEFIQAFARQVSLTRKSLIFMQVKAERQMLDQQLSLARDIQSKFTPSESNHGFGIDIAVCYKPAMWVGGDYCDVWSLENGQIAFAVGDVSGKGLPAAMIMSNLQAALRTTMNFCTELSTVAKHVNQHLCQNLHDDMFVTLFLGLFDPEKNELAYVNAGHLLPLIMHPSESVRVLGEVANIPLGIFEKPFEMFVEKIYPDTSLLVTTDGITEATSPEGERFKTDRLAKLMAESKTGSARDIIKTITESVADFRQTLPQQDDITVFALINRKTSL